MRANMATENQEGKAAYTTKGRHFRAGKSARRPKRYSLACQRHAPVSGLCGFDRPRFDPRESPPLWRSASVLILRPIRHTHRLLLHAATRKSKQAFAKDGM